MTRLSPFPSPSCVPVPGLTATLSGFPYPRCPPSSTPRFPSLSRPSHALPVGFGQADSATRSRQPQQFHTDSVVHPDSDHRHNRSSTHAYFCRHREEGPRPHHQARHGAGTCVQGKGCSRRRCEAICHEHSPACPLPFQQPWRRSAVTSTSSNLLSADIRRALRLWSNAILRVCRADNMSASSTSSCAPIPNPLPPGNLEPGAWLLQSQMTVPKPSKQSRAKAQT